ncbi:Sialin [Strongyloides ratti]|uniref:Sialin n=1 Tax=Strongyloides ratti TaxID=34506 RepID=A0A090MRG6_STRRB|nr:Sialin [Strongyloides ratti]CEF60808.1 Sialin [Strongyloides ratti]
MEKTNVTINRESSKINLLWSPYSRRLRIAILLALALGIEGLMRSNINMAMICMIKNNIPKSQEIEKYNLTEYNKKCMYENGNSNISLVRRYEGEFEWSGQEQSYIFTSFYLGGLFSVIPGAYLCTKFGSKYVVFWGAVLNVAGTFLTPLTARYLGPYAVIVVRFIMGTGQGILVPCMNVLIADWFPMFEKSMAVAIATTGNQISVITALFLTAELCQIKMLGGWPAAFYIYAIIGTIFCTIWFFFVIDRPELDKKITQMEINFINGNKKRVVNISKNNTIPWKKIITSSTVLAASLNSFAQNFFNVGLVTYIPLYYKTVLRANLTSNGIMSALPFIVQLVTKITFATMADYLKKNMIMSNTNVTKMFNFIGSIGASILIFLVTYFDCENKLMAVILIMMSVAPKYTAVVGSYCRIWAQFASVLAPFTIGLLVKSNNPDDWKYVFYILTGLLSLCGIHFQIYGSSSPMGWAKFETQDELLGEPLQNTKIQDEGIDDTIKKIDNELKNLKVN